MLRPSRLISSSPSRTLILLVFLVLPLGPARGGAIESQWGMVAADHKVASKVGVSMLDAGGNAVDAAVATALVLGVINPTSSGLGGGAFILILPHPGAPAVAIDAREVAPGGGKANMFLKRGKPVPLLSVRGGKSVAVPGEAAGLLEAHRRFGRLPFATVAAPAIRLARYGFVVSDFLAQALVKVDKEMQSFPALRKLLFGARGLPPRPGDLLRRPAYAGTIEALVLGGEMVFQEGKIAKSITEAVQAAGGILTLKDMAAYSPRILEPLMGTYRGHRLLAMPLPSSGGPIVLQALNVLESFDLAKMGPRSPETVHLMVETLKHAFADRAKIMGDPDFVEVDIPSFISKEKAAEVVGRISLEGVQALDSYGTAPYEGPPLVRLKNDHGTSHLSVIDQWGGAVALTTTVNRTLGSMVLDPESGVLLNNEMDDFTTAPGVANSFGLKGSRANAVAPGKRPLSSMCPIIVLDDKGGPSLVVGASGGPKIITSTLQVLVNVMDFGIDIQNAVDAPRFHHQWLPDNLSIDPEASKALLDGLTAKGQSVVVMPVRAAVQAVVRHEGRLKGASDPRKGGIPCGQDKAFNAKGEGQ